MNSEFSHLFEALDEVAAAGALTRSDQAPLEMLHRSITPAGCRRRVVGELGDAAVLARGAKHESSE